MLKRVVIVADNPLIVAAIRSGVRETGALELVGYADPREATAQRIKQAGADVVLVDEGDHAEVALELIRSLRELGPAIKVLALTIDMRGAWIGRALMSGASGALSKSLHPSALTTLIREAANGHIVHAPIKARADVTAASEPATDHVGLTERELEILRLVSSGAKNGDIARTLWITQQTVKFHVSNIYRKLDVSNRTEACHYAHVNGLVSHQPTTVPEAAPAAGARVLAIAS
jgi:DNA-binding NarL/FixJ family response regulator